MGFLGNLQEFDYLGGVCTVTWIRVTSGVIVLHLISVGANMSCGRKLRGTWCYDSEWIFLPANDISL